MRKSVCSGSTLCCASSRPLQAILQTLRTASGFAGTMPMLQIQHPQLLTKTHGYGFIKHEPLPPSKDGTGAPPADLENTPVDRGQGTGPTDPYVRTLPNLELRPPEATVLSDASLKRPTIDEVSSLQRRSGTLGYWLGGDHPRLPLFLASLKSQGVMPLSSAADSLLAEFELRELPRLCNATGLNIEDVRKAWSTTASAYNTAVTECLFSLTTFEEIIEKATKAVLTACGAPEVVPPAELMAAVELLRLRARHQRNQALDALAAECGNVELTGHGTAVWTIFFEHARRNRSALFLDKVESSLSFLWESLVEGPSGRDMSPIMVSAEVALYFFLVTKSLAAQEFDSKKHRRMDAVLPTVSPSSTAASTTGSFASTYTSVDVKARMAFVKEAIASLHTDRRLTTSRAMPVLKNLGLSDAADLLQIILAAETVFPTTQRSLIEDLLPVFSLARDVEPLITQALGSANGADMEVEIRRILKLHGCPALREVFADAQRWTESHASVVPALLSIDKVRVSFLHVLDATLRASAAAKSGIFCEDTRDKLQKIQDLFTKHQEKQKQRVNELTRVLSSYEHVDLGIAFVRELGASTSKLDETQAAADKSKQLRCDKAPLVTFSACVSALAERHAAWVRSNVLTTMPTEPSSIDAIRTAARIYLRLAYMPQAGQAIIASRTRRRIGQIGTSPQHHNVPIEVGQVERYDNLLHKRYDWQGWYQRMVDVHNRNISIRCKLHELQTLDTKGRPFVDLQSERRLRIVAKDRVGMGIVKLDSDKFEDQSDNLNHGVTKFSQLLADARKTQLGPEYIPTVEVKVRRPSGQSQMQYSLLDSDRIEKRSSELYIRYRDAKKKSFFVTPMDLWLDVKGLQARKTVDAADAEGYTVDGLFDSLKDNTTPSKDGQQ